MDDFMTKPFMMESLKEKLSILEMSQNESSASTGDLDLVVDRSVLRSLAALMDDEDTVYIKELLNDYLVDAERLRGKIYEAVSVKDASALRQAAHTLKSTSATFGARQLSTLCAEIEQCSIREDISCVERRLEEFDETLVSFHTALVRLVETETY